MSLKYGFRGGYILRTAHPDQYIITIGCETNNTSAPDGDIGNSTIGAWTYQATGILKYTFAAGHRPRSVQDVLCGFHEATPDIKVLYNGDYSPTTGVLTFTQVDADAGGVDVAAATNDKTFRATLFCTRSSIND
jgi:hypothetical protein